MEAGISLNAGFSGAIEKELRATVGSEHVRVAVAEDSVAGVQPQVVVEPGNEQELAQVLRLADEAGLAVTPRGGGTKLAWGNPPARADLILSTARLHRVLEHAWADLTVSVEAGCTVAKLQEALAQHRQRLALDPLWPERATVGGVLSTNDSGALRLRFGSLRDLIIGVTLALPDGTLASSGGKVVKNVAGYDLQKLVTGALGTLGVITRAVFRVHPLPKESSALSILARDAAEAQRLVLAIQDSKLAHSALQMRFVEGAQPQIDVLFEATGASLAAQTARLQSIIGTAPLTQSGPALWTARHELHSAARGEDANAAIAKFSTQPAHIAGTIEALAGAATTHVHWKAVVQAAGIGCVLLEGDSSKMETALKSLREGLERAGGSVMIAHRPAPLRRLDAWGAVGDALPLMRAVKQQFDPKNTLNPGRFVGGI
jgi:glycolate oxidase FAD binding subunit